MDAVSYSKAAKQEQRIQKFIQEPDSNSGIVTVPSVIEVGESVTIPAGRTAVLPNLQVDGILTVDGEVFVPSGATQSDLQSQIDSNKADINTINTTSLPAKADRTFTIGGDGYAWVDVTASRSVGVTYTNTTGKPIMVSIKTPIGGGTAGVLWVDGLIVDEVDVGDTSGSEIFYLKSIVPNGSTYSSSVNNSWMELR